jgi:large subunit ribosomal protein L5
MPRLKDKYEKEVIDALVKEFDYKNVMAIPKITKVVVNIGLGEAIQNVKLLDGAAAELATITGQRPVIRKARKAIATFKLREGMPIGTKVTLRSERMYEFLDRLISIGLPRVRDFRGVSPKAFDGRGNYTLGLKDQIIFPEIDLGRTERLTGMNVTIVTTAKTDEEARFLLQSIGMPFSTGEQKRLVAF